MAEYSGVGFQKTDIVGENNMVEKRPQARIIEFSILYFPESVTQQSKRITQRQILQKLPGIKMQTYLLGQCREIGLIEFRNDFLVVNAYPL